jgi:hypothetical protein
MATLDTTSTNKTNESTPYYAGLHPLQRAEIALEMVTEIKESMSQHFTLASVIASALAPAEPGGDSTNWHAYRLAQLLEEVIGESSQMYRLIDCLTASRDVVAQKGGTV